MPLSQPTHVDPVDLAALSEREGLARGMYGVKISGLENCGCFAPVPQDWPEWRVVVELVEAPDDQRPESAGPDRCLLRFGDGSTAEANRVDPGANIHLRLTRDVAPCHVAHPYLAAVGMFSAYWGDRLPLHAGAVGIDGKAWLILATKAGGKSTTLALLERAGHPVLADDLSVIDPEMNVHRGPRFVDLRREAAETLGIGTNLGVLGVRERWRHPVGDAPLTLPLGGIVATAWGDPGLEPVAGSARLELIAGSMALRVPGSWNELVMDVALSVPLFVWRRPENLAMADAGIAQLVDRAMRSR